MELDINSRPPPVSFSASPPHPSSSSVLAQRRRSSAAHVRPAGPPPNLPIPSVPVSSNPPPSQPVVDPLEDATTASHLNGRSTRSSSFARHTASPNLTAVAEFSQARLATSSPYSSSVTTQSSLEDLSDPPPQSYLRPASQRDPSRDTNPDQGLLTPPEPRSEQRPSSRRALTRALELAREAVQLDSTNDNPEAAVHAYARSVALLSEVMERVRRGEEADSGRRRRRRSVAAQEEEVRRLQNIHDTYADRMHILSIIYNIPAIPYSSLSTSTDSTTSNSPTTSTSPSSDSSPQLLQHPHPGDESLSERQQSNGPVSGLADDRAVEFVPEITGLPPTANQHPYAHPYESRQHTRSTSSTPPRRGSRAAFTIPPPNPPPMNALPPAPAPNPAVVEPRIDSDTHTRQRGGSTTHKRTGSGLAALEEEFESVSLGHSDSSEARNGRSEAIQSSKRDSHPLPPLPSPGLESASGTPRTTVPPTARPPPSPGLTNIAAPRPKGTSTTHSESAAQPQIINSTTAQGTIYQRRTKSSAPPSSRPSSPADSTASAGSIPAKSTAQSLPATGSGQIGGRSRSSSQPGRRPSLVGGRISPLDQQPPPLPNLSNANGVSSGVRKISLTSKLGGNPTASSQLFVNTDTLSPTPLLNSPAVPGNLPTTPTSPLPPAPPNDPSLKPYHMMNLLRVTMTSTTGGYVTRRLHVPYEVWSQGGAKLTNVVDKVRIVNILCSALEELQISSAEHFGAGNVSSGMALGIGSIGRKEADAWLAKLEEFSNVCDGVVTNFGKKLGVGEGFVLKKTTWGDKLTRRFDKFTNGKNLDSPAAYVLGLKRLFQHTQLLDEHIRAVISHPVAPAYAAFPPDIRSSAEQKLKRSSEFFATVVLTFVIRDLSLLLDKYVKKCEKWLAE